jgi:aryl-alcohol dehydrogenase-like predicted oxidoreductase
VLYAGVSNFPAWQAALSLGISERLGLTRFDCVQPRYNLLYRDIEAELLPLCRDQGIGVIAYNPLAGGFLSGKYQKLDVVPQGTRFSLGKTGDLYRERYWHQAQLAAVAELRRHFEAKGVSLVTAAVAWVLAQPGVTAAIVGASRPEQLHDSLAAAELRLDDKDREVANLAWYSLPRPVAGPR